MKNMNNNFKIKQLREDPAFDKESKKMDVFVKLAVEVNEVRNNNEWSQQELARRIGTTQRVISKIENADINIGLDLLQRLARSLNSRLQFGDVLLVEGSSECLRETFAESGSVHQSYVLASLDVGGDYFNAKNIVKDISKETKDACLSCSPINA